MEVLPCGQGFLETRLPFSHPLQRATSQVRGHHQLRWVVWTEKAPALHAWKGLALLGAVAVDLMMSTAVAKVLPPDKRPPVCNTKAESVPTIHVPTRVSTAPRSILSLSHWGFHCSCTWHPAAATPGPPASHPAPRAGDLMGEPGEEHISSARGEPAPPAPAFPAPPNAVPELGTALSSSSMVGREGAQPDRHCPPHPGSKVTLNTHPVPCTPISRAGIPPLGVLEGAHTAPQTAVKHRTETWQKPRHARPGGRGIHRGSNHQP